MEAGYRSSGGLSRRLLRCISRGAIVPFGTGGARRSKQAYDGMGSQDMWFTRTSEAKSRKREAIDNHLLNPLELSHRRHESDLYTSTTSQCRLLTYQQTWPCLKDMGTYDDFSCRMNYSGEVRAMDGENLGREGGLQILSLRHLTTV